MRPLVLTERTKPRLVRASEVLPDGSSAQAGGSPQPLRVTKIPGFEERSWRELNEAGRKGPKECPGSSQVGKSEM